MRGSSETLVLRECIRPRRPRDSLTFGMMKTRLKGGLVLRYHLPLSLVLPQHTEISMIAHTSCQASADAVIIADILARFSLEAHASLDETCGR